MHQCAPSHRRVAFSLVELSIVLVIIGLLAGGVMAGTNLIRAAKVRTVLTQYDEFRGAMDIFRDKYNAVPGDFANAQDVWGYAGSRCTAASYTGVLSTDGSTCNGNGDGLMGGGMQPTGNVQEIVAFWQHLSNAQLIEGQYNGRLPWTAGETFPTSQFNGTVWVIFHAIWNSCPSGHTECLNSNQLTLTMDGFPTSFPTTGLLSPREMEKMDFKIDDGKPNRGKFLSLPMGPATCTSGTGDAMEYRVGNTDFVCSPSFLLAPL